MLVRKANRVDLIRLLLQKQSDLGLLCVGSISSQLLMELSKRLLEITEDYYQTACSAVSSGHVLCVLAFVTGNVKVGNYCHASQK